MGSSPGPVHVTSPHSAPVRSKSLLSDGGHREVPSLCVRLVCAPAATLVFHMSVRVERALLDANLERGRVELLHKCAPSLECAHAYPPS